MLIEILKDIFSIYIVIVMFALGLYFILVQSKNLIQVNHLIREGKFLRWAGWFYILMAAIGFVILWI